MTRERITSLIEELSEIRTSCLSLEKQFAAEVDSTAGGYRDSVRNLLHYLGLRQHDLSKLQQELRTLGLSWLARTEAHVLAGADAVLVALHALAIADVPKGRLAQQPVTFETGPALLEQHTSLLLGPVPDHGTRIMVTMPSQAGDDYRLIRDLLAAGMDLMRIDCAHDSPDVWRRMISNLEAAQHEVDRPCRVMMDLAGPKLRTGELGGNSRLVHWKVRKNPRGEVIAPARIRVVAATGKHLEPDAAPELPVGAELLAAARTGDYLLLESTPNRPRKLRVVHKSGSVCWAETNHSGYAEPGTPIALMRNGDGVIARGEVGEVPWLEEPVLVFRGEFLVVTAPSQTPCNEGIGDGHSPIEARVPCTLPEVFQFVEKGHRILFDEGRIEGVVVEAASHQSVVEVTRADRNGSKLRSDRPIHLPDSNLQLAALTDQDLRDLDFVAAHADIVGLSFVRGPQDLLDLQRELEEGPHRRGHRAEDGDKARFREPAKAAAYRPAETGAGHHGGTGRLGRGNGFRAAGGSARRDFMALQSGTCTGNLCKPGPGSAGEEGPPVTRGNPRRRVERRGGVPDVEQGATGAGSGSLPGRHSAAYATASFKETSPAAQSLGIRTGVLTRGGASWPGQQLNFREANRVLSYWKGSMPHGTTRFC